MNILKIKEWLERRKKQEELDNDSFFRVDPKTRQVLGLYFKADYPLPVHVEKRVFKIDVGEIDEIDIQTYINKVERQLKNRPNLKK